jgi:uncharacterized protein (DUF433 family)
VSHGTNSRPVGSPPELLTYRNHTLGSTGGDDGSRTHDPLLAKLDLVDIDEYRRDATIVPRSGDGVLPAILRQVERKSDRSDAPVRHDVVVSTSELSILARPVYGVAEAAGLLGLRPDRARAWLDGYERGSTRYAPVIRPEPTRDDIVTWGEFVELGYLREYRRKGVPLQRLRPVIEDLRRELGTPHPLATAKPYVYDKELVLKLQEEADLPPAIAIVIRSGQEILMTPETQRFFKKVEFDPGATGDALRLRPAGPTSPVVIDPLIRFGRPCVLGVATDRLWELYDAGESLGEIATGYDLEFDAVGAAIAYEEQFRSLAA